MSEIKKAVLGSVRLDSDVWAAVRAMPSSLNVYLRNALHVGLKKYEGDPPKTKLKPRERNPLLKPKDKK